MKDVVVHTPEDRVGDPREEAEWFGRLPEHARDDLRDRWRRREGATEHQRRRRKRIWIRTVAEGAAIFTLVEFSMGYYPLVALFSGAVVGGLACWFRAGTFGWALLALAGQLLLSLLTGSFFLIAYLMRVSFCAVAGTMHAFHRSDGSEAV